VGDSNVAHCNIKLHGLRAFLGRSNFFEKVRNGNVEPCQNLKDEKRTKFCSLCVGHALNALAAREMLKPDVVGPVFDGFQEHRIAFLKDANGYAKFKLGNSKLLLRFFLWQF